jgi:HAD superfamily, subfamily IIIB (Acid phosphatase)
MNPSSWLVTLRVPALAALALACAGTATQGGAPAPAPAAVAPASSDVPRLYEAQRQVEEYISSGRYDRDFSAVVARAQEWLEQRSKTANKPAIVLDIDETSLSNYTQLNTNNFSNAPVALATAAVVGTSPAISPTLALYQQARAAGISVFAITGRPSAVEGPTRQNLTTAGYTDLSGIFFKPSSDATIAFKSGQRAALEQQGYRIVANVGDQESDLSGGHADRSFKLPNPFYFIS